MIKDIINRGFGITAADPRNIETPGTFVLANVATTAKAVEWMPDFAVGLVKNNGLVKAREHLAPNATVMTPNTTFSYRFFERAESFKEVPYEKLVRGVGGEFGYFNSKSEKRSGELEHIGISVVVEKAMSEADPGYESRLMQAAVSILESATLRRAYDCFTAVAVAKTWSKSGSVDPDTMLRQAMLDASDAAGVRPNRILFGDSAWDARVAWLRSQNTAAGFQSARTEGELGSEIRADILVPDARVASGSGLFPAFAAKKILGGIAFAGTPEEDVSNVKMFTGKNGLEFFEWDHPQGALKIITASRWQCIKTTSDLGAFAITVTD